MAAKTSDKEDSDVDQSEAYKRQKVMQEEIENEAISKDQQVKLQESIDNCKNVSISTIFKLTLLSFNIASNCKTPQPNT